MNYKKMVGILLAFILTATSLWACGSYNGNAIPHEENTGNETANGENEISDVENETVIELKASDIGIVKTQYGEVQGETYDGITVFKGVPYAAPPVDNLRWREPQECESWEGVRICDEFADAAIQPPYIDRLCDPDSGYEFRHFYPDGIPNMSEDCLYLDIYTPADQSNEKLPVFISFHGGYYNHGYSYEVEFNGEALADKGAIVVNVGHRLGVLGMMSLPQLTDESEYGGSGNYMIMDCCKAVRWVRDNIAAFGGDPERITVGGQSGGAYKATACLLSPLSEHAISGVYCMSSFDPLEIDEIYSTQAEAEAFCIQYLEDIGIDSGMSLEELRRIPAEELYNEDYSAALMWPVVMDGYSITTNPTDFYLTEGNLEGLNLMYGYVFGEAGSYGAENAEELRAMLKEEYGEELYTKYDLDNTLAITDSNVEWYNRLLKVKGALADERLFALIATRQNKDFDLYGFCFTRVTPGSEESWHSSDLWYMYGSLRDNGRQRDWQIWDYMTAENCTSYMVNFLTDGDPNEEGLNEWPKCTEENGLAYQLLDYNPVSETEISAFDYMAMESIAQSKGIDIN